MNEKPLHIVSFDNPYPPQYGGTIEVYFKIKALYEIGYSIYLHCFTHEVPSSPTELDKITEQVYYYKIAYNPIHFFSKLPLSVISRSNKSFVDNILKIKAPILFESLKTTLMLNDIRLRDYKKILRMHNIEQDYFLGIAKSESGFLKKILYYAESRKFRKYEAITSIFDFVLTLSKFEDEYISKRFGNSVYVPVFHGNSLVEPLDGLGKYALYHGDLTTADNRETAKFLISIFKEIKDYPLVVASGTNENFIKAQIGSAKNIKFVKLKDFTHLKQLLNEAHLNLIWSFQRSGTKLKLINSLFHSRFCIINKNIIDDPDILSLCIIAEEKQQIIDAVKKYKDVPYNDSAQRALLLESHLNDIKNATEIEKAIQKPK